MLIVNFVCDKVLIKELCCCCWSSPHQLYTHSCKHSTGFPAEHKGAWGAKAQDL